MASFEMCLNFVHAESGLCEPTTHFKYYHRDLNIGAGQVIEVECKQPYALVR